MRALGIDPLALTPEDVAWHHCWARRRGWAVLQALDDVRREGLDPRTPAGLEALLQRAEALRAAHLAPIRRRK